jgi:hypothetical protein
VLDLRIAHERLNDSGVLLTLVLMDTYITLDVDRSLNEAAADKIRNRTDYNNIPPIAISFMSAIPSTSGRIHSEFVRLLFYKLIGKLTAFFASSGVQLAHSNSGLFHYRRVVFSCQLKSKIVNILAKVAALRIILNIDGVPVASRSHTHPSHS